MTLLTEVTFAFGAGAATFFAPCVYGLLPGYVSYYVAAVDGESPPLFGAVVRGLAAAAGALLTVGVLSMVAVSAGGVLADLLPAVEVAIGVGLVVLGIVVLRRGSLSVHIPLPQRRASVLGFGLFGAVYALAATGCVLPLFLALALQSLTLSVAGTVLVIGTYAATFGVLLLSLTVATAVGYDALSSRLSRHTPLLLRAAGAGLILGGLGQTYVAFAVAF